MLTMLLLQSRKNSTHGLVQWVLLSILLYTKQRQPKCCTIQCFCSPNCSCHFEISLSLLYVFFHDIPFLTISWHLVPNYKNEDKKCEGLQQSLLLTFISDIAVGLILFLSSSFHIHVIICCASTAMTPCFLWARPPSRLTKNPTKPTTLVLPSGEQLCNYIF
jgi:hypothetical protein